MRGLESQLKNEWPWLEALVRQLVDQDSCCCNPIGINIVQDIIAEEATKIGLKVMRTPLNGLGDFLQVDSHALVNDEEFQVIIGHSDTVVPHSGKEKGSFRSDSKCWYGTGILDMKAGIGMVLLVLKILAQTDELHSIPLRMLMNSSQEPGNSQSPELLRAGCVGARAILVAEAGARGNNLVTRRSGAVSFKVEVEGLRAHVGSNYLKGASAVSQLARLILKIESLTDLDRQILANVGVVSGGVSTNVVSDLATAHFEVRFPAMDDLEEIRSVVHQWNQPEIDGTVIKVEEIGMTPPLDQTTETLALFNSYRSFAPRSGLKYDVSQRVLSLSDANHVSSLGIPIIDGLGPYGEGVHTKRERVYINTILPKAMNLLYYLRACSNQRRHAAVGAFM